MKTPQRKETGDRPIAMMLRCASEEVEDDAASMMGSIFVSTEYIYNQIFSPLERSYEAAESAERCEAMRAATADTSGRGRPCCADLPVALNGRRSRGGSPGRGSEKKRTRFPDGVFEERNADGRVGFCAGVRFGVGAGRDGAGLRGAKKPVARVGSSVSTGDEGVGAASVDFGTVE